MKRLLAIFTLLSVSIFPVTAAAQCIEGSQTYSRSYKVSCEKGVKIYRHQVLSPRSTVEKTQKHYRGATEGRDRQTAIALQLKAQQLVLAERQQAVIENDRARARRDFNRRRPYSRRYVSYGRRGIPRGHFRSARVFP